MKKLPIIKMECVSGGSSEALDWICGGVSVGRVGVWAVAQLGLRIALGPVGAAVSAGCAVYNVGKLVDWW